MPTHDISPPPFWPSHRLWLKFFLGLVYVPLIFSLLIFIFIGGLFSPTNAKVLYIALFILILLGGPISTGILLSPSWRGVGAGIMALVGMVVTWGIVGYLVYGVLYLDEIFPAFAAGSGIFILESLTQNANKRLLIGRSIGILSGLLLALLFANLFSPYRAKVDLPSGYDGSIFIFGWSMQISLVWLNTFFFADFFGRRVGRGGILIWVILIGVIFGISFTLMK